MRSFIFVGLFTILLLAALCKASQYPNPGQGVIHRRPVRPQPESGEEYQIAIPQTSASYGGAGARNSLPTRSGLRGCISLRRIICGVLILGILILVIFAMGSAFFGDSLSSHFQGFEVCGHSFLPDTSNAVVGSTCLEHILNPHGDHSLNLDTVMGEGVRIAGDHLPRCVASAFDHMAEGMFDTRVLQVIREQLENSGLEPAAVDWNWYWMVLDWARQSRL